MLIEQTIGFEYKETGPHVLPTTIDFHDNTKISEAK